MSIRAPLPGFRPRETFVRNGFDRMPWVVPTIAAELWGIGLAQVLLGMEAGTWPSCEADDFRFVYASGDPIPKPPIPAKPTPPTYSVVSQEELSALYGPEADPTIADDDDDSERGPLPAGEEESPAPVPLSQWREARRNTARTRRRPGSAA